ncbi:MAG: hypothetical protein ABW172_02710, partial [Candidatus Binatia bacterium]
TRGAQTRGRIPVGSAPLNPRASFFAFAACEFRSSLIASSGLGVIKVRALILPLDSVAVVFCNFGR